jgi:RNA polymerase sigma-B factor
MPHRRAQARRRAGHDGRDRGAPRRLRSGSTAPSGDSLGRNDKALAGVELHESLAPALATLPQRERRILQLRFYGNQTQSQIATQLGISQMHESRLLARTLTQLREQLTD